jgi:hypothetical protein
MKYVLSSPHRRGAIASGFEYIIPRLEVGSRINLKKTVSMDPRLRGGDVLV